MRVYCLCNYRWLLVVSSQSAWKQISYTLIVIYKQTDPWPDTRRTLKLGYVPSCTTEFFHAGLPFFHAGLPLQCLWFLNIEQCFCVMRLRVCLLTEIKRYKSAIHIRIRILPDLDS